MTDSPEKRRFARIDLDAQIKVAFPGTDARRQLLMENLSAGGLFIRTPQPKPIGTRLQFEFSVRDGGKPIVGAGIVRWIEPDPQKHPGMGIQFTELNEEGRRELSEILQNRNGRSST